MCSRCYKEQSNTPEMWVDAVKKAGLQCVAITDHNDYRGINEIKKLCKDNEMIVFPGVELSCSDRKIHMLILFDNKCDETDVQEFLFSVGVTKDYLGESGRTCEGSIFEVCEKAKKKEALVIAAHIDEFSGINELSYDNLKQLLDREYISAVQIVNKKVWDSIGKTEDYQSACEELSNKYGKQISVDIAKSWHKAYKLALDSEIPMLTFSDNPSAKGESTHGLWGIGSAYTWMKMDQKPNLESIRQTLLSADMRVKTNEETNHRPDDVPELWIKSIKIRNTILNREDFEVSFNPQLNSIIGGRGSGKSSIIRMLAGGLQSFDGENLEKIKEEQEAFYRVPSNKDKRGVFNKESRVEIVLERVGEVYKLEISNIKNMSEQQRCLYKLENDEWKVIEDDNYLDFFKAQIYTQKQIYELALDSSSLLSIIDEDITELSKKNDKKEVLLSQMIAKRTGIWNLEKAIEEERRLNTEIKDIEEQISKFEKSGISEALKDKQKYESQKQLLNSFLLNRENRIDELIKNFEAFSESIEDCNIDNQEITSLLEADKVRLQERQKAISDFIQLLKSDIEELNKSIEITKWKKESEEAEKKYIDLCSELKNQGLDFSRLDELLSRKKEKNAELEKINNYRKQVIEEKMQLDEVQKQYESIVREISMMRSEFISSIIGQGSNVKFEIQRNRNRSSFVQTMKSLLNKDINTIDENINDLADIFFGKDGKNVFRKQIIDIREGNDKKSYSAKFRNIICDLTPETYARMISFLPEDDLKVSYKPEGYSKYIPLSNASAGQKTTAILTFLLAYGRLPLLLDQPEDDLDNKLVYDLIVSRLKTAKSKRQIIVVTHNANIPVNADSEYIISMNSETEDIMTKYRGTMDDENIRKEICDVMEGTKYAFEMRAKKYHFKIVE
jgi:hypothetical protein